jgi:hypothetical protein
MQQPFTNRGLHVFKQRRPFSNPLDPDSFIEDLIFGSNTDVQAPTVEPLDWTRGARDTASALSGTVLVIPPTDGNGGGDGVTGSGTTGRIAKWTSTTALGNSVLYEVSGRIGVDEASPDAGSKLDVSGLMKADSLRIVTGASVGFVWKCSNADGSGGWEAESGGASQLSDLSDVNTSTPTAGHVLRADGVDWESVFLTAPDVDYTPAAPGDWIDPDPTDVREALDDLGGRDIFYLDAVATPSDPSTGTGVLFTRTSGNNIQLIFRAATGEECVLCTLVNVVHVNTLLLNWME